MEVDCIVVVIIIIIIIIICGGGIFVCLITILQLFVFRYEGK